MKKYFAPAACAAAILLSSVSVDAILAPAAAQDAEVSFDSFHDYLANYGDWVYSDRWGEVWIPANVPDDFQPYGTNGYWAATDNYGWVWVSNYAWGDVPFHYGRWVNDPDDGWMWIPGYVWSPAWVVWRHSGEYTGWMPMPPDPVFLGESGPSIGVGLNFGGISIGINFNDTSNYYGYSQWYPGYDEERFARNWVFVGTAHLADRDFQRYQVPHGNGKYVNIIHNTTNITNYTVVNNYVVNRGVDPRDVQRASGHPIVPVRLNQVIKRPQFVAQANTGLQIQQHQRQINPRGNGHANSAPPPSQKLVQGLSNKVPQHGGHAPAHVFTKTTVIKAPAFAGKIASEPGETHGPNAPTNGPGAGGGAMSGPNAHEEKFKKPGETGGAAPGGETMHGPGETKGPAGAMSGPNGGANAPQDEHRHKPSETGGAAATTETPEHHMAPATPPAGEAPTMTHKHENTGGGATGGMNGPSAETPMTHKHESTGGASSGGGAMTGPTGGGERQFERRQPTAAAPAATPPVQHEEHKPLPPPAEHAAPPPSKPEDKDKKDKKDEPH